MLNRDKIEEILNEKIKSYKPELDDKDPQSFDEQLHLRLAQANEERRRAKAGSWIKLVLKPLSLFVLFVMIACSAVFLLKEKAPAMPEEKAEEATLISKTEVESKRPVKITMEYTAARDLKNVKISFDLDEGISFDSTDNNIKTLKKYIWEGDLHAGLNEIPFIVNVEKQGRWEIETKADFEGLSHRHRIVLTADERVVQISYFKLPETKLNNG